MTSPDNSRRAFFKTVWGETLRGAREAAPMLPYPVAAAVAPIRDGSSVGAPVDERPRVEMKDAPAAAEAVGSDALEELVVAHGLSRRLSEIRSCAVLGLRMHPTEGSQRSYLADQPLAHIDFSEVPAEIGLPKQGALQLSWLPDDATVSPARLSVGAAHDSELTQSTPRAAVRVAFSSELSLPRAWSEKVIRLELTTAESAAWQELRLALASRQGVEASLDSVGGPGTFAVHRLVGYPDERRGFMPAMCEAADRDIDLTDQPVYEHPGFDGLQAAAGRWRLLFQLSLDRHLSWDWGTGRHRLYVWTDREDLRSGQFTRAWTIVQ